MTLPTKNLDDRNFDALFEEARQRLPQYLPEYTDHNESDPGIALLQLFSWIVGDNLLYRLNQLPDERVYIAFLNLLGIEQEGVQPAQTAVSFATDLGTAPNELPEQELLLSASVDGEEVFFEPKAPVPLIGAQLGALLVDNRAAPQLQPVRDESRDPDETFRPFGGTGTRDAALYLGLETSQGGADNNLLGGKDEGRLQILTAPVESRDALAYTTQDPAAGRTTTSDVVWEGWTGNEWSPLGADDGTQGFRIAGRIRVTLTKDLKPRELVVGEPTRYWIRARAAKAPATDLTLKYLAINATEVIQWRTFTGERLRPGSNAQEDQTFTALNPVLIHPDAPVHVFVEGEDAAWQRVDRLPARRREGRPPQSVFEVRAPDQVVFGDGEGARIPPIGRLLISYKSGGGVIGNGLGDGDIGLARNPAGVNAVRTLETSAGGANARALEDVKELAGQTVRTNDRAVTAKDFEHLAREKAGVGRAIALNRVHPRHPGIEVTGAISLIVVPPPSAIDTEVTETYLQGVAEALEPYRTLTTELYVVPPRYREVEVRAKLTARGDIITVKSSANDNVRRYLDPLDGGPTASGWPLGRAVGYAEIVGILSSVDGVVSVAEVELWVDGVIAPERGDAEIGGYELVRAAIPQIEITEAAE